MLGEDEVKRREAKAALQQKLRGKPFHSIYLRGLEFEIMMMEDEEENDIMNRLDYIKLETIYQDYKVLGGDDGLDLHTFIAVMTQPNHLGVKKESKKAHINMVRNLIDLFRQIDVNNDKSLEWVEFTNHIIELGMVRKDKVFIDAIKNY